MFGALLLVLTGFGLLALACLPEPGQNAGPSSAPAVASAPAASPAAAQPALGPALAPAMTQSSGPSTWIDIIHPIQIFDLTAPELAKSPLIYTARRHEAGGGRQDILTFGGLDSSAYLRLQLYRVGSETVPSVPLYVDLTRAAAAADLSIVRSLPPAEMPTRFGPFEVSDVTLAQKSGASVPCLGFRGVALDGGFRVLGFACGGKALTLSRPALGCLVDRLDLAEAGDDQTLSSFFAASELRRNPACAGNALRPTVHRASWLERNDAPPPLQGKKPL
ncbi:MAG TPA: hypothetical protein VL492_02215 [Methylovirgula sp.]|nr:hypothetical protein [Methylovirgula sp.]